MRGHAQSFHMFFVHLLTWVRQECRPNAFDSKVAHSTVPRTSLYHALGVRCMQDIEKQGEKRLSLTFGVATDGVTSPEGLLAVQDGSRAAQLFVLTPFRYTSFSSAVPIGHIYHNVPSSVQGFQVPHLSSTVYCFKSARLNSRDRAERIAMVTRKTGLAAATCTLFADTRRKICALGTRCLNSRKARSTIVPQTFDGTLTLDHLKVLVFVVCCAMCPVLWNRGPSVAQQPQGR
jgi:hypothetical protein